MKERTYRIPAAAALFSLGLMTALGTGCGNKDAADSAVPPPAAPPAGASMPPQAAAAQAEQSRAMEAQKRMNDDMAKARQAAEQSGK